MKFSIRDLLLVTVIVALAVGWWVDRSRNAVEKERIARSFAEQTEKLKADLAKAEADAEKAWHILGHMPKDLQPE